MFQITEPTLDITASINSTQPVSPGEIFTLMYTVMHAGKPRANAYDIILTINVPPGLTISNAVTHPKSVLKSYSPNNGSAVFSAAVLKANNSWTVALDVVAPQSFGVTYSLSHQLTWRSTPRKLGGRSYKMTGEQNVRHKFCMQCH